MPLVCKTSDRAIAGRIGFKQGRTARIELHNRDVLLARSFVVTNDSVSFHLRKCMPESCRSRAGIVQMVRERIKDV